MRHLPARMAGGQAGGLVGWWAGGQAGGLGGWWAGGLVGRLVGWWAGGLVGRPPPRPAAQSGAPAPLVHHLPRRLPQQPGLAATAHQVMAGHCSTLFYDVLQYLLCFTARSLPPHHSTAS